jgi:phosphotransacetylase
LPQLPICARLTWTKKFDAIFNKYYEFLNDEYMVTVANVVGNSAKIARAKPYLIPRITAELLRVDKISISPHLTDECRRVIAEQAIKSFNQFFDIMDAEEKAAVLSFVEKYTESSRASLARQAELFLKRWSS